MGKILKQKPKCKITGCLNHARGFKGLGFCFKHYQRVLKHGNAGGPEALIAPPGAGHTRADGYRAKKIGSIRKYEHILIAEKALGKSLPKGACVHHVNENRSDNRPENLVICPDAKYHSLLHLRMAAINAGYPAFYRKCGICKKYDDPNNMYVKPSGNHQRHRGCKHG